MMSALQCVVYELIAIYDTFVFEKTAPYHTFAVNFFSMKKLFVALLAITAAAINLCFASDYVSPDPDRKEIIIRKPEVESKPHRDSAADAKAFLYESSKIIEVELFETGPTTIYVLNAHNQVVDSETAEGYEYESVTLQIPPAKGNYTIIILGTYLYGEGTLTIE